MVSYAILLQGIVSAAKQATLGKLNVPTRSRTCVCVHVCAVVYVCLYMFTRYEVTR